MSGNQPNWFGRNKRDYQGSHKDAIKTKTKAKSKKTTPLVGKLVKTEDKSL